MRSFVYFVITVVSFSFFVSCVESDDFSSNPNLKVAFSSDTVRFDTVFTTFGTATKRMKVYNKNSNSLTLESVELVGAGKSGFRINVDGFSGNNISNVEILKEDSIYIFIEVTVDPQNSNSPMLISDSIRLRYNGNTQYIQLEAYGQDAHLWRGKTITKDTTLTGEKPFLIFDSLVIAENVTLNIQPNTRLFFGQNTGVKLYGNINAKGTLDQPIVFRGNRTDNIFTKVPYDRIPGQWGGIVVDSVSFNNHFEYVHVRNSVYGFLFNPSVSTEKKATFINSMIQNTSSDGVSAVNCWIDGYNSLFSNAGGTLIKVIGGRYEFIHCTFANYLSWFGLTSKEAIIVGNITDDKQSAPLNKCDIINSIITNSRADSVKEQKSGNESIPFNRSFKYCLVKVRGSDDGIDIGNVWNEDPSFKNLNKNKDYYYSFEIDSVSPAINRADRQYSIEYPIDIRGVSRLSDENPDMGCYEWVKAN